MNRCERKRDHDIYLFNDDDRRKNGKVSIQKVDNYE